MAQTIASAFIAQLLAPIPTAEEQADTKAFRKAILHDMHRAWSAGVVKIDLARAEQVVAMDEFRRGGGRYHNDGSQAGRKVQGAIAKRLVLEHLQCLIPAPTAVQMRWKQRLTKHWRAVPAEIADAIASDAARFSQVKEG